jgi:hypothetical protein
MVHLLPLPGSPLWQGSMDRVVERACQDAGAYEKAEFHAILVENFGDAPFTAGTVSPHTVAAMAWTICQVRRECGLPVGVNVLRNDWRSALALACVCGGCFVRVNVHAGVMLTDQGVISGNAHDCLRYRRALEAERIGIFADVWVKHGIPLGCEPDLVACARDTAIRGLADALIVTGKRTGEPPQEEDLVRIREACPGVPLLVGSGLDEGNVQRFWPLVDGMIVGTAVKDEGQPYHPVSHDLAERLMAVVGRCERAFT